MGATYDNTKQSKCFVLNNQYMSAWNYMHFRRECVGGYDKDIEVFLCSTFKKKHIKFTRNWSKFEVQTIYLWASAVFVLTAQTQKWKSMLDICHRGTVSIVSAGIVTVLAGVELQTSQFHRSDSGRNSEGHTLLHPGCHLAVLPPTERHWNVLFLLNLSTHAHTLLHWLSCILSLCLCYSVIYSLSSSVHSLIVAGSQIWVWLCHLRRQGQASPGQRGHGGGGIRCAAQWTGHRTPVVSWLSSLWCDCRNFWNLTV